MPALERERYEQWARTALASFPIQSYELCFLGHSDNLTFRVEETGGALYLLRLHYPAIRHYRGLRQETSAIGSELTWLNALHEEGGLAVQRPVAANSGMWVADVEIRAGQKIPATVLSWLPGKHFSPAEPNAPMLAKRFGRLVAKLHNFSVDWVPPEDFYRPRYDLKHFRKIFGRLLRGIDLEMFNEMDYRTLRAACEAIVARIEDLPQDAQHWGVVHADLHVGNFLVYGGWIIPIDFSFCGFGHYLFDLSVCVTGGLKNDLRVDFFAGYQALRRLGEEDFRAIESYALAGRMSYFSHQLDNPTERAWLQRRLPLFIQNTCRKFLDGESIIDQL